MDSEVIDIEPHCNVNDASEAINSVACIVPTSCEGERTPSGGTKVMSELSLLRACLERNESIQELLLQQERTLLYLLEECRKEQQIISKRFENCIREEDSAAGRFRFTFAFGTPYFKDETLYPSPCNEDYNKKQSLGYFEPYDLPRLRLWKDKDKRIIEESIKKFELSKQLKENAAFKKTLEGNILSCTDSAEKENYKQLLEKIENIGKNIPEYSLARLVGNSKCEYDWMKISTIDLKGMHTPEECRSIWFNYLHPSINRKRWTKVEDDDLKAVAKKSQYQDWERIAKELGTNRSGYQCLCHFQMRLNESMKRCKWTPQESETLSKLVNNFQVGDYIPWGKIAYCMDGRTKNQVYSHWVYVANPDIKKGKFTKEEDIVILAGVRNCGLDFARIARVLPNRTSIQVRQRFGTLLQAQRCPPAWTTNDDLLILQLVQKYGEGRWKEISEHFPVRTNYQIRFRYNTIQKWFQRNPEKSVPNINSRKAKSTGIADQELLESVDRISRLGKGPGRVNGELTQDIMTVLSSGLLGKTVKKRGRRVGQSKTVSDLDKEYDNFFRCAYAQIGGKAKGKCSSNKIPEMARRLDHALNVLRAKLNLPSHVEEIDRDKILMPVDKKVLKYFAEEKSKREQEPSQGDATITESDVPDAVVEEVVSCNGFKSEPSPIPSEDIVEVPVEVPVANRVESEVSDSKNTEASNLESSTSRKLPYLCPPNFSTIVGLRTFLLSRHSLQKNSNTSAKIIENAVVPLEFTETFGNKEARNALNLLNERLFTLFTWPALMSNTPPVNANRYAKRKAQTEVIGNLSQIVGNSKSKGTPAKKTKT